MNSKVLLKRIASIALLFLISAQLSAQQVKILFIGNSYTYVNNLPQLLHDLALSNGDSIFFDSYTPGGYTFQSHSTDPNTLTKIYSQQWDFVVLQEQSQRPSFSPGQVAVQVYPYAAILDSLIHDNNPCTETVFYMTWGRKYGDASNCAVYPPVCTYEGMQARLRESYIEMGTLNNATVAPVGSAWKNTIDLNPAFDLYDPDESHPSIYGSYLAACTFYATLFHRSPQGNTFISTLSQTDATFLQTMAGLTVIDSLSTWYASGNIPLAEFNHTVAGLSVQFQDQSLNADSVSWNFGDGGISTLSAPLYTYNQPGTYLVTLVANNICHADILTDTVVVTTTGLETVTPSCSGIQYDRNSGILKVDCPFKMKSFRCFTLDGRLVGSQTIQNLTGTIKINLPAGAVYLIELGTETSAFRFRLPVF